MSFGSRINASQEPTSDRTHIHTCGKNTLPPKSDGTGCVYNVHVSKTTQCPKPLCYVTFYVDTTFG